MNKKTELKRLLIFLAFAFGIAWAVFLAYSLTGHTWDNEDPLTGIVGLGMLAPFAANLITRWITKEGFAMTGKDSLMLGISFKGRKWIFYLLAVILPWIYYEIQYGLALLIWPDIFDSAAYEQAGITRELTFVYPLAVMVTCSVASFAALGEEGGWRGYMMPKLVNLVGLKKAILIGGVLWGVWHAPLTCAGHNFGTEYPGFPYLGIALMCAFCTLLGIILIFLTVKSQSVWPAVLMHAVNNGTPSILRFYLNAEAADEMISNPLILWILLLIPIVVITAICYAVMSKTKKAR